MDRYPSGKDDNFYKFVNKKYGKYKIKKEKKTLKQICFPTKYQFQVPQKFLADFINPDTPYKRILIYHRIGAGKTCTAISIAENFKKTKKIMVVLPASLKGNFRTELRSPCGGNIYLTASERTQLSLLHPQSDQYKSIIRDSDDRIDKAYTIYSYNKFIDLLKNNNLQLNNTLLIIDEVHNMISETGTYYENLYNLISAAPSTLRLVILSATPIFDKPVEIALTMNLLIDNKLPTNQQFINTFIDIKYKNKFPTYSVKNIDLFKKHIRGHVSYFRGAPPHAFPKAEVHIVKCKMSDNQLQLYKKVLKKEKSNNNIKDYVNKDISNNFFIGIRMISNFVFPNKKTNEDGYLSLRDKDLTVKNIKKFSPKFIKILRRIKRCDGTVLVYSNFKEYGGIKTFVRFLEVHGFKNYEKYNSGRKRFAIWSGDQEYSIKEEIKSVFNRYDNRDGSQIKIILGSPSIKEGISLLRVQEVHLMETYWNQSRNFQIIGRAIRFCSHKDMPPDKRLVKVYIYLATHPEIKRSIDEHILKMAIDKQLINLQFEKALKQGAIDCYLFKNANVYRNDSDIKCEI